VILGTAQVIRANSRHLPLADNSVDLVVTSPPYFALRSYQDGGEHYAGQIGDEPTPAAFVASLLEVTAECVRVLKPSGSLWVNLGDKYNSPGGHTSQGATSQRQGRKSALHWVGRPSSAVPGVRVKSLIGIPWRYALRCIDDLGLILRAEVIWSKPNGLPESVTDRVRRSHETWFHFTLEPRYFSGIHAAPHAGQSRNPSKSGPVTSVSPQSTHVTQPTVPGSVWTISTNPLRLPSSFQVDHIATFPPEWPRRLIKGWCPEGGTVLDPFGGTGTTALAAKALGRHGISVDMSADYCRLAEWRTNDRNQLAKVLGVAKAEQQPADQAGLFDLDGGAA
jgi:DNA modification methylase